VAAQKFARRFFRVRKNLRNGFFERANICAVLFSVAQKFARLIVKGFSEIYPHQTVWFGKPTIRRMAG
jgi:hypothetical protein